MSPGQLILFVEDEITLRKSVAYILEHEGYRIITTSSGEEAVKLAQTRQPDLMLLDLVLPGIDGFEVCKRLKRNPGTADMFIVMLTGKRLVSDVVRGLKDYADDYITKPFEPEILLARIQAVLRRKLKSVAFNSSCSLEFPQLTIRLDAHEVSMEGEIIRLTKTEFDLLVLLAGKPNIVFSRVQVLDHIREDNYDITERVVDYQVSGLRKKLGKAGDCIETVRGIGYKFKA